MKRHDHQRLTDIEDAITAIRAHVIALIASPISRSAAVDSDLRTTATVDLELHASDRVPGLSGQGSRSLVNDFGGRQIGAMTTTSDGADLDPGTSHAGVLLTFWAEHIAQQIVNPGATFIVWYGGSVGTGVVRYVSWAAAN